MSSDPRPDQSIQPENRSARVPPETMHPQVTALTSGLTSDSTPFSLSRGTRPLPDYELIVLLGRGGCGEVWKAMGPGGFEVALKFVRLGEQAARVEQRSLELMKGIRHAHLLPMFGAWQREGQLIIAMELADRTLWQRWQEAVEQGLPGIPPDELLGYLQEAAKGLDFLNERRHRSDSGEVLGIQHKDIKPQNLLLVGGTVKVADFGLAKVLEHTVTNASGGLTPAYAAPEFFQGQATRWSDQYCLAVSYCLLRGGRLPFEGTGVQIMAGHVMQAPDLSMLPEGERAAVARALSKDPQSRWPSCRDFAAAVADGLGVVKGAGDATTRIPRPAAETAVRSGRRVRSTGLAAAVLLPALAAVAVVFWWGHRGTDAAADRTGDEGRQAMAAVPIEPTDTSSALAKGKDAKLTGPADAAPAAMLRLLAVAPVTVETGKTGFLEVTVQRQDCTGPVRLVVEDLPAGVSARAATVAADQESARIELHAAEEAVAGTKTVRVRADLDQLRVEQQALVTVHVAPSISLVAADNVSVQRRLHRTVTVQLRRRNYSGPIDLRLEGLPDGIRSHAVTIAASADRGRLEITALARAGVQTANVRMVAVAPGVHAESPLRLTVVTPLPPAEALADYDEAVRQHPDDAGAYCDRGRLLNDRKEYTRALADLNEAVRLDRNYSAAYFNRANVYVKLKEQDKALDDCDRAIELDPQSSSAYNCRGVAWAEKGELARALDDYTKAIQLEPRYAIAFSNRGNIYTRQQLPEKAMVEYDQAIRLDSSYVLAYLGRAVLHRTLKEFDKAIADYDSVIKLDPQSVVGFNNRGYTYMDKGEVDKAIADYTEAIRLDPKYLLAYQNRARAYDKKGDADKAKADRAKAKELTSPTPAATPKTPPPSATKAKTA
jgi:Tfp pilus assembly protein PilF